MKLNSKGFAITSIIYSMLILFLTLVVLIIGNLASRKAVFDKQKEDILDKLNQISDTICTLANDSGQPAKTVGAKYNCDPGDGKTRIFYLLEDNESSGNISLIMDRNIDDTTLAWCKSETNNSCNADGAKAYLNSQTSSWTVSVSLPTAYQILAVDGYSLDSYNYEELSSWLYDYLADTTNSVPGVDGYWTSTAASSYRNAWSVNWNGYLYDYDVSSGIYCGVRPIITISESQLG